MSARFSPRVALMLVSVVAAAAAAVLDAARRPFADSLAVRTTVVLARLDSPYRVLGQEIAALESVPLVDSLPEALTLRPEFLLWVVSPTELSDQAVTSFSLALDRTAFRPSAGLITGSTLERARDLYRRVRDVKGGRSAAILGKDTFTTARIVEIVGEQRRSRRLTGAGDVLDVLTRFDYVQYAGHGGSGYWRPLPDERIASYALGGLPPVVISTMSCQTTRIWEPGSIGLRMVDAGAAAYSGFYYSPMAGYQIGEEDGPFRLTWPDVPIGHVVAAMNEGARKGYATFPFHLLLGDPRIALGSEPPCRLQDQGETGGVRRLSCLGAPSGLVPVRIRGGARYAFVEVAGSTTAWEREPFFNRRARMATIGDDRILLVEHSGGDLQIQLRKRPPLTWLASNSTVDALDSLLVSMADRRHGGDMIALVLAAIAAPLAVWRIRRRRSERVHVVPAAAVGLTAAILHLSYGLARQRALVVISKPIVFSPLAAIGTGVLAGCGALFFLTAKSWRGRLAGTLVATSVGWVGGIIAFGIATVTSAAIAAHTGVGVWIYRADFYTFVLSGLGSAAYALVFSAAGRIAARASAE